MIPDDELISAYLDDELSADERRRAEALLVDRADLRRLFDDLRSMREVLKNLPAHRLEPDFGSGVLRRAERELLAGRTDAPGEPRTAPSTNFETAKFETVKFDTANRAEPAASATVRASQPAATFRHRRPIFWSIVAMAAAVALMFLEQRRVADEDALARVERPDAGTKHEAPRRLPAPADRSPSPSDEIDKSATGDRAAATAATTTMRSDDARARTLRESAEGRGNAASNEKRTNEQETIARQLAAGRGASVALAAPADGKRSSEVAAVAQQDQARARQLVRSYQTLQTAAPRTSSDGLQRRAIEAPPGGRFSPNDDVLIVTCEVDSPETLERSFVPVLRFNRIADVSAVAQSVEETLSSRPDRGGRDVALQTASQAGAKADADAAADETFYYVVAEGSQLESTLTALNADKRNYLNLTVEPAPQSLRQQAWSSFNRGIDDGLAGWKDAQLTVSNALNVPPAAAPAAIPPPAPVAAMPLAAPAAPLPVGAFGTGVGDISPKPAAPVPAAASVRPGLPTTPAGDKAQPSVPSLIVAAPPASTLARSPTTSTPPTSTPPTSTPPTSTPLTTSGAMASSGTVAKTGSGTMGLSDPKGYSGGTKLSAAASKAAPANSVGMLNLNAGGLAGSPEGAAGAQAKEPASDLPLSRAQRLEPAVVNAPSQFAPASGPTANGPQVATEPAAAKPESLRSAGEKKPPLASEPAASSPPAERFLQAGIPAAGDYHEALFIFRFRNRATSAAPNGRPRPEAVSSGSAAATKPVAASAPQKASLPTSAPSATLPALEKPSLKKGE